MPSLRASSRKRGERGVGFFLDDGREQLLALGRQDVGHFRRLHVIGAGALGLADHAHRGVDIGRRRQARAHLDHRRLEGAGAHARCPVRPRAAASSLPARSSACSSSLPPTCSRADEDLRHGHAVRCARSIISSRRCQSRADVDFGEGDALALQQRLGRVAIGAIAGGVDFDGRHGASFRGSGSRYMGVRTGATTRAKTSTSTWAAPARSRRGRRHRRSRPR